MASAVNAIDSWTLITGRYLRSSPLVRVGITMYLLALHVWVFRAGHAYSHQRTEAVAWLPLTLKGLCTIKCPRRSCELCREDVSSEGEMKLPRCA